MFLAARSYPVNTFLVTALEPAWMAKGEGDPTSMAEMLGRLRSARKANDEALKEVAAKVGVKSFQAVQRWESGEDRPSGDRLRKWLRAVNMPNEWAALYEEFAVEEDLTAMIAAMKPPPAPAQIAAIRMNLRNALRTRRE